MPYVMNYGTPEDAQKGREGSFAPPEKSGDYLMEVTNIQVTDNANYPGCTNWQISCKVLTDAAGAPCPGTARLFFMSIPPEKEVEYEKIMPNMQKMRMRDFLIGIGIDLGARDSAGKRTMTVEPDTWKGRKTWGYIKVYDDTFVVKDKVTKQPKLGADGKPETKTIRKGDIENCYTYEQIKVRNGIGQSLKDATPPPSGDGEIPADA